MHRGNPDAAAPAVRARAHYLKNSVDILGGDELREALQGLDEHAQMLGVGSVQPLLDEICRVLARRCTEHDNVASESSDRRKFPASSKLSI